MRVLGIDPGFAAMGVARVWWTPWSENPAVLMPRSEGLDLWETKPDKTAKKSADSNARIEWYASQLWDLVQSWRPDLIAVEMQAPQANRFNLGVVQNLGRIRGLLDMLSAQGHQVIELHPHQVRRYLDLTIKAEKAEVEEAVCREVSLAREALEKWPPSRREHPADAVAIAFAGYWEQNKQRRAL